MEVFAISGFFSGAEVMETRFERGASPQDAVARLMRSTGDFRVAGVVSESEVANLMRRIESWKELHHG